MVVLFEGMNLQRVIMGEFSIQSLCLYVLFSKLTSSETTVVCGLRKTLPEEEGMMMAVVATMMPLFSIMVMVTEVERKVTT